MHLDVLELQTFYYRTSLGRVARAAIRRQMGELWPATPGATMAGFGFAVPLLRPYLAEAARVVALMPEAQGVMPWPPGRENRSVLVEERRWPLAANSLDRLVVLHGLETSQHPGPLLEECARVLEANGRALFVVPNRAGLWARRDRTPFGVGRPYSLSQLEGVLREHGFRPERHTAALYAPPSQQRFWLKTAAMWERAGQRVSTRFAGGVLLVEASKELDMRGTPAEARARRPLRVLEGLPHPAREGA